MDSLQAWELSSYVVTVIALPMTIVTSFFGMNFQGVPWWDHALPSPGGFMVAIVAVLLMDAALLALFRWKKWL